jgi:serine/threonine-protein kinase
MAPEQARGEIDRVDERSDAFGLGAILCEILTGAPAYTGKTQAEVVRKAEFADLDDALARLEGCGADPELVALARRCLRREPGDRPRDASEVAAGVASYLAGVQDRLRKAEVARAEAAARAQPSAPRGG